MADLTQGDEFVLSHQHRLPRVSLHVAGVILCVIATLIAFALYSLAPAQSLRPTGGTKLALEMPPSPPPVLEPLEIIAVAPEKAAEINATVPFSTAPNPAARAFLITGSEEDRTRAIDCLASAIFYEAGYEAVEGQRAVAQVVINRVRHPAYPKSVCNVVYQGQERSTGCQFSFTCDGAMARVPSSETWSRMQKLAKAALTGSVYKPVGLATHYHTDWVLPAWSAKLEKIRAERTHLFFRWAGWWGTPPAFRGKYASAEPAVAKLARLSIAHANALPTIIDPETGLVVPPTEMAVELPQGTSPTVPRFVNAAGDFKIYLVDRKSEPNRLAAIALAACNGKSYCKILMWTDAGSVPSALPVSDVQLSKLSFSYLRNLNSGYDKALWNCALFKKADAERCMTPRASDAKPIDQTAKAVPPPANQSIEAKTLP